MIFYAVLVSFIHLHPTSLTSESSFNCSVHLFTFSLTSYNSSFVPQSLLSNPCHLSVSATNENALTYFFFPHLRDITLPVFFICFHPPSLTSPSLSFTSPRSPNHYSITNCLSLSLSPVPVFPLLFSLRLTSMRKTSSHGEGGGVGGAGAGQQEQAGSERGTLHTKRHSGDHHDLPRERYSPL